MISVSVNFTNEEIRQYIDEIINNAKLEEICDKLYQRFPICRERPNGIHVEINACKGLANICRILLHRYEDFARFSIPINENTWYNNSLKEMGFVIEDNHWRIYKPESEFNRQAAMNIIVLYAKMRCDDLLSTRTSICQSLQQETMYPTNNGTNNPSISAETEYGSNVFDLPLIVDNGDDLPGIGIIEEHMMRSNDSSVPQSSIVLSSMRIGDENATISEANRDDLLAGEASRQTITGSASDQNAGQTMTRPVQVASSTRQTPRELPGQTFLSDFDAYLNTKWRCTGKADCSYENDGGFKCMNCHAVDQKRMKKSCDIMKNSKKYCQQCSSELDENMFCQQCTQWTCHQCTKINNKDEAFCNTCLTMSMVMENIP